MNLLRWSWKVIGVFGLLAINTIVWAQNTTPTTAAQYGTDQGWVQTTLGPTVGTNEQRWYSVELRPGRSYCMETALGDFGDVLSDTVMYMYTNSTLSTLISRGDDYAIVGFTRGCFYNPTNNLTGASMGIRRCCVDPPATASVFTTTRVIRFRLTDTTVTATWWFTNSAFNYDAYVELANNYQQTINVTVKVLSPTGAVLATASKAIAGKGSTLFSVATGFPVAIPNGSGSIEVGHDGPVGAINLNVTTISATQGVSFDSPGSRRTTW